MGSYPDLILILFYHLPIEFSTDLEISVKRIMAIILSAIMNMTAYSNLISNVHPIDILERIRIIEELKLIKDKLVALCAWGEFFNIKELRIFRKMFSEKKKIQSETIATMLEAAIRRAKAII